MSRTLEALERAQAEQQARDRAKLLGSETAAGEFAGEFNDRNADNGEATITFHPSPSIEEKYQKLQGVLFGRYTNQRIRTLLVVASTHGEGATTTATYLASVLAKANRSRVLLVDTNLRTPSASSLQELRRGSQGFTDLLSGKAPLSAVIQPASSIHSNLSVIPSGRPLSSPSYVFDSDAIDEALEALSRRYDHVILDGAPIRDYSDSCFLSSKVDGSVIVVEFGKTPLETTRATKRQLERYGANVVGTVLNKKRNYIPAFIDRFL